MVACEIDKEVSGDVLGWSLPTWQALLLHRVLPSCGGFIVYLIVISFDIALIYEHYRNGDSGIAAFCIVLMILPALLSLVFTLSSPPPGLKTEAFSVTIESNDVKWIVMQFVNFLFFPVAAVGRYCHQIFWWVEAVCAARDHDDDRTRDALKRARAPSPLELYLFLQAFIHSAPHVVLNILDLMSGYRDPAFDKIPVQAVSLVASTLRMASTATLYRRFEREKLVGRTYPWKTVLDPDDLNDEETKKAKEVDGEPIYETLLPRASISEPTNDRKANSNLIQFSPVAINEDKPWFNEELDSDSGNSSDYISPISRPVSQRSHNTINSDDEYVRPISIIDRVAPKRRDKQINIERVVITPPPSMPAPRPMSLAVWAEKMVENAESIPDWLSAPHRRRHLEEIFLDEPDIPRRAPRSFIRGLEPQDATAALVQYLGWYSFFVSRLLSIAAFINCTPVAATIVLFSHYQVMLLLLIVPQASTVRRAFYIFLSFIYLFCLMEFKIRFRHVRVWHVFWIIVCTVETIIFTGLWSSVGNNLGDWWRAYVVKVIHVSLFLSYMCFLVYFVLLKPRETIVYINNKSNVSK